MPAPLPPPSPLVTITSFSRSAIENLLFPDCPVQRQPRPTVPLATRARLAHEARMTSIGILGVHGRMGRAIGAAAAGAGATIAGGIDREGQVHGDHATLAALAAASDVLVDFTGPDAHAPHLAAAVDAGQPIVLGTTGPPLDP